MALVPKGRSNEEVAALLELSIPSKKVYLLRGCQQDDYEGMLDILQKELAPTRDIFAKLSPSPSFNFSLGLRWLYFQLLQAGRPAGRPSRIVLSKHNTALLSKVKLFNLTSRAHK